MKHSLFFVLIPVLAISCCHNLSNRESEKISNYVSFEKSQNDTGKVAAKRSRQMKIATDIASQVVVIDDSLADNCGLTREGNFYISDKLIADTTKTYLIEDKKGNVYLLKKRGGHYFATKI